MEKKRGKDQVPMTYFERQDLVRPEIWISTLWAFQVSELINSLFPGPV